MHVVFGRDLEGNKLKVLSNGSFAELSRLTTLYVMMEVQLAGGLSLTCLTFSLTTRCL